MADPLHWKGHPPMSGIELDPLIVQAFAEGKISRFHGPDWQRMLTADPVTTRQLLTAPPEQGGLLAGTAAGPISDTGGLFVTGEIPTGTHPPIVEGEEYDRSWLGPETGGVVRRVD